MKNTSNLADRIRICFALNEQQCKDSDNLFENIMELCTFEEDLQIGILGQILFYLSAPNGFEDPEKLNCLTMWQEQLELAYKYSLANSGLRDSDKVIGRCLYHLISSLSGEQLVLLLDLQNQVNSLASRYFRDEDDLRRLDNVSDWIRSLKPQ